MTKAQIINKLESDPYYVAQFVVDNNFPAIKVKMNEKGYFPASKEEAVRLLLQIAANTDNSTIDYILNVPYINATSDYTGGLSDYFIARSPAPTMRTFDWMGLLAVVGGALGGLSAYNAGTSGATLTPAQIAAQKAAAVAAEKARKRKMWITIGVIFGIITLLIVIVYFVRKRKKG